MLMIRHPFRQLRCSLWGLNPLLEQEKVSTLLIGRSWAPGGPFAALSDGQRFFGDRYAFVITPPLALTDFASPVHQASDWPSAPQVRGLSELPLVPQELNRIDAASGKDQFLNREFTPARLLEKQVLLIMTSCTPPTPNSNRVDLSPRSIPHGAIQ